MKSSTIITTTTTVNLPVGYMREIGRIMIYWAHIEFLLRRATHDAADVGQKIGRIALMEPKPDAIPDHIHKIFQARRLHPPKFPKGISKDLKELHEWRNAFAHGIWMNLPKYRYPVLQYLYGSRKPMPDSPGKGIPYKVDPVSYAFTVPILKGMADYYKLYIPVAHGLRAQVRAALLLSNEK